MFRRRFPSPPTSSVAPPRFRLLVVPLLVWISLHGASGARQPFKPIVIDINTETRGSISGGEIVLFRVDYFSPANETVALRIRMASHDCENSAPLLVVVRTKQSILSWQLPLVFQGETAFVYTSAARIICPLQNLLLRSTANRVEDAGAAPAVAAAAASGFIPLFSKIWNYIVPFEGEGDGGGNGTLVPSTEAPTTSPSMESVYIDVSSASNSSVDFTLRPTLVDDFALALNRKYEVGATPSEPAYRQFTFPSGVDQVQILATAFDVGNTTCAIISIQEMQCPVYDLVTNVENAGIYQTMTQQATITVDRSQFRSASFYVVVVVKPQDLECNGYFEDIVPLNGNRDRFKTVTIRVVPTLSKGRVLLSFFASILIFLSLYFFTGIFTLFHWKFWKPDFRPEENPEAEVPILPPPPAAAMASTTKPRDVPPPPSSSSSSPLKSASETRRRTAPLYGSIAASVARSAASTSMTEIDEDADARYGAVGGLGSGVAIAGSAAGGQSGVGAASAVSDRLNETLTTIDVDSSDDEDDDGNSYDMLDDVLSDKNIVRTKSLLFVSDLSRKNARVISRKYYLYFLNLVTISVFYALPVMQLVMTYQTTLQVTGNEDTCYYNWRCAYRLGPVNDFNNVASNMGYVFLGCLFLALVARRELLYHRNLKLNPLVESYYGLPQHFGLLYALGFGLVMEGVMSACYHICPNKTNFQFDTSYMYMLACLQMLKIYQSRHPDINAGSHAALGTFAGLILVALIGVLYGTTPFYAVYGVIHVLAALGLSAQIYYMGRWRLDSGVFRRTWLIIRNDVVRCTRPSYPDRLFLILIGNIVNWSLIGYGAILNDFATYLVAVFIVNLLLYFAFYIIMKIRAGERVLLLPLCCILLMTLSWGVAIYFFAQVKSDWDVSPAESRELNAPCLLLGFYDHHDIWHFVSAFALFFSFCILLTLDDDLTQIPRHKISVF